MERSAATTRDDPDGEYHDQMPERHGWTGRRPEWRSNDRACGEAGLEPQTAGARVLDNHAFVLLENPAAGQYSATALQLGFVAARAGSKRARPTSSASSSVSG